MNITQKFTSRSPIEDYQKCPRLRYLRQFYPVDGKPVGITPVKKSIPLSTGSCIHKGIEYLFRWVKSVQGGSADWLPQVPDEIVQNAVTSATKEYYYLVFDAG